MITTKKCPYCGEQIRLEAKKCRYCGEWLDTPPPIPDSAGTTSQQPHPSTIQHTPNPELLHPVLSSQEESSLKTDAPSFFNKYFARPYWKQYADFGGITSCGDFWHTYVATIVIFTAWISIGLMAGALIGGWTEAVISYYIASGIWGLAFMIPALALQVRRLRDAGHGWPCLLLPLIPLVGCIILLVYFIQSSVSENSHTPPARFKGSDWLITLVSVALFISAMAIGASSFSDSFNPPQITQPIDLESLIQSEEVVEEIEEPSETHPEPRQYSYSSDALPVKGHAANAYPDYRLGADWEYEDRFENILSRASTRRFSGEGYISKSNIRIEGALLANGQLIGRYHNENGINLDLNGYVDSYTGELKIRLGHDSETSYWTLTPILRRGSDYHYTGTWGKAKKPSDLTISLM